MLAVAFCLHTQCSAAVPCMQLPAVVDAHGSRALCSSLAVRAARLGAPWLLSFSGMAAVLGWPPRAPLVAECDRGRVLRSWAGACGGREPRLRMVPFAAVRGLQPAEFVHVLAEDLQVRLALGLHSLPYLNNDGLQAAEFVRALAEDLQVLPGHELLQCHSLSFCADEWMEFRVSQEKELHVMQPVLPLLVLSCDANIGVCVRLVKVSVMYTADHLHACLL